MGTRLSTLNIRHGGTKSAEALAIRLLGYDADILVVTEFRANAVGARLIDRLEQAGYDTSHPAVGPKLNTVLIAARIGIERSWAFGESLDPRHLWCAEIDGAYVCGVCMPQNTAKLPYWEALIRDASTSGIDLLVGDFNTGTNDLDKDPRGARFIGPEMPGRLIASGYTESLVEQQTNEFGWEFLYMGADQDAVEVGKGLGVKAEQAVTYGRGKSREAMAAMSGNVRGYRNAKLADMDAAKPAFSDEQRVELSDD